MNRFNLNDVQVFTRFGNQEFNSQKIRKLTHRYYKEPTFHQLTESTSKLHISIAQYSLCTYLNEPRSCNTSRVLATLKQPPLIFLFPHSMFSTLEVAAKGLLADPSWNWVFKNTFDAMEEQLNKVLPFFKLCLKMYTLYVKSKSFQILLATASVGIAVRFLSNLASG